MYPSPVIPEILYRESIHRPPTQAFGGDDGGDDSADKQKLSSILKRVYVMFLYDIPSQIFSWKQAIYNRQQIHEEKSSAPSR